MAKPTFIELTRLFNQEGGGFEGRPYTVNANTIHKIEDTKSMAAGRAWVLTEDDGLIQVAETRAAISAQLTGDGAFVELTQAFGEHEGETFTTNAKVIRKIEDGKSYDAGASLVTTEDDGLVQVKEPRDEIRRRLQGRAPTA